MDESQNGSVENVSVSMEITGEYEDVMSKLQSAPGRNEALEALADDLTALLETVERTGGGTKSALAGELPEDLAVEYDAEAVVEALQVLERYDLVELEGNTWKPGPAL